MLVYISGMSCTGKTTLIEELKSMSERGILQKILGFPDNKVEFISELTRSTFHRIVPNCMSFETLISNPSEYLAFMEKVFQDFKRELGTKYINSYNHLVFCDRAPIDYRINLMLNYNNGDPDIMKALGSYYLSLDEAFSQLPEGNFLFMTDPLSIRNHMEYDGFRPEKYSYRRLVEKQYFLLASKLSSVRLLPDGLYDRVGFICRSIIKG